VRLQQLALRVHDEPTWLRFHERLTVITGIETSDRQGLVEVILGTLAGETTVSHELAYVQRSGQRVTVDQRPEGTFHVFHDDGTPADPPVAVLGLSVRELFDLMYVDARQLGILQQGPTEPKELAEARAALAALRDQLEAATVAKDAADALRVELVAIDEEIRQIEAGRPRRRYAKLVVDLTALRTEREAVVAPPTAAEADRVLAAHLALLRPLAARWRAAVRQRSDAERAFGARVRLDPHTLAGALAVPDRVPPNLDSLVDELAEAEAVRAAVSAKLAGLMAAHIETPSHPDVARLARADQGRLWSVAARAIETGKRLEEESLRLGGFATEETDAPAIVQEIESAHEAVEQAQEVLEKRKGMGVAAVGGAAALGAMALPFAPFVAPLALAGSAAAAYWAVLAPRQQLAEAQDWETDALIRAGVPSYLSFHLRRMEAMQDPTMRASLERASRDHRKVMHEWRLLAGDIGPAEALGLQDEVRRYAASVDALVELGDDVTETRRRLVEQIEPAVERAREALLDACRPFGIEHPTLAADIVRQLAEVARVARLQSALEAAEREEEAARRTLEEPLAEMERATDGADLATLLARFEERAARAEQRVRYRTAGRARRELDREIERLEALVRSEWRPEYGSTFTVADARDPDPEALQARREMTAMAYHTAIRLVPDVARLADRCAALERRVGVLEAEFGEAGIPSPRKVAEIERELQHRLTKLRHCGQSGEPLPLLMDECFLHLRPDVKWAMLDLVDRLSGHAQVAYLSNDPDVATWARRRATTGTIAFLDPLRQPVG
jgi:hypothetical protein